MLFCLAWYVPFWIVLELTPTKLPHYLLPSYPALMLLGGWGLFTAQGLGETLTGWKRWISGLTVFGLAVMTVAFAAIAAGSAFYPGGPSPLWGIVGGVLALGAGYLASGFGPPVQSMRRIAAAAALAAAFMAVLTTFIAPNVRHMWLSPQIASLLADVSPCPETRLASVNFHEPSLVFQTATDTLLTDVAGAARHLSQNAACNVAVLPRGDLASLEQNLTGRSVALLGEVRGTNYSNGRPLDLIMVRLSP